MKTLHLGGWFCLVAAFILFSTRSFAGSGAVDPTFAPGVSSQVNAVAVLTNGQILVAGSFTTVGGAYRYRFARLYADGSLDGAFQNNQNGASGPINAMTVQSDGHILVGGSFTTFNYTSRPGIARLNANGTLDGSFTPSNSAVTVLAQAVQSDGKVLIGGNSFLYRLNTDGSLDNAFFNNTNANANGGSFTIYAIAVQPDGRILIGGSFYTYASTTRNNLARLYADGTIDGAFLNTLAGPSSPVRCLQIQPDGKILIGGDFSSVNGANRNRIARLTSSGAVDTGFYPSISGSSIYALSLQSDGSVVIGGNITASYYNSAGGYSYSYNVARLYADGSMDTAFQCPMNLFNPTYAIAIQGDGGVIAGGNFNYAQTNRYLGRLYGNVYPPEFTQQPTNRAVAVGSNVTFTAHVSNPTPVNFQWRKNGSDIAGATGMSYSLYNVQLADAGTYAVFATDTLGGVTSTNAILIVGIAPAITQQPVSLVVTQGQPASFTVGASGTPLKYFWKKGGLFIPGATNASFDLASAVYANAGSYTCQISNFLGNVTSLAATLTVFAPPGILTQPVGGTVGVSSNFSLSVMANGTAPLAYQWFKDGAALTNFTDVSLALTNVQLSDAGGYFVVITNSQGSITSSVAAIVVTNFPPNIVAQPAGGNCLVGSNFSLTVSVGGSAPFAYQWNTNGVPIPGATFASYSVTNAQTNDSAAYSVVITNLAGSVTSSVAWVNVGYAPVILQQPVSISNAIGDTNGFNVTVFGSDPMLYQWFKDGLAIANATNASLVLTNLQTAQVGFYSVSVTNAFGGVVSSNALLMLTGVPADLRQGLVAYYPFNGNASDASGNGNDGVVNGATLAADRFGNTGAAYAFSGSGQSILVSNAPSLNTGNQLTIGAWVNFDVGGSGDPRIISKETTFGSDARYELSTLGTGSQRPASFYVCTSGPLSSSRTLPAGQWAYLLATYDGAQMNIYINGQLDSTLPASGTITNTDDLVFGQNSVDGSGGFAGKIDDVRIYNRALSQFEAVSLYVEETDQPAITQQPQGQTNVFGAPAQFSVVAASQLALAYQWQFNGTNIIGATNATLLLTNVTYASAGSYCVAVSNGWRGVVSSNATLTVTQPVAQLSAGSFAGTNGFGLTLTGLSGHGPLVIYASSNLLNWDAIFTNPPQIGALQFLDPAATNSAQRFYRAIEQ